MDAPERSEPTRIRVGLELRSGDTLDFEIDENTCLYLVALLDTGLEGPALAKAWLGPATPLDPPVRIHVVGTLSSGRAVELSIPCADPTSLDGPGRFAGGGDFTVRQPAPR